MAEVRKYGRHLSMLLQEHVDNIEEDCLDQALLIAVNVNNSSAVAKLVMRGVDNILDALKLSTMQGRHQIRGFLLLVIAAADGSRELVLKLFGEEIQTSDELQVSCDFISLYNIGHFQLGDSNNVEYQFHFLITIIRV